MGKAILPMTAGIIGEGKFSVSDLEPGDRVVTYSMAAKVLNYAVVLAVRDAGVGPAATVFIQDVAQPLHLALETALVTTQGETTLKDDPKTILGYCKANPKIMNCRRVERTVEEVHQVPLCEVEWEGASYLRAEGVLVGCSTVSD